MAEMPQEKAQNPGEAIFFEARCARQTSQELLPLLKLLQEDSDDANPLDEIKGLLAAIIEILGRQNAILERLDVAFATAPPSPPSSVSTSTN